MVWYSHLFKNFPQYFVIHTIKGFGVADKAEVDVFLELSCFVYDPTDAGNLISGSFASSKSSLNIWIQMAVNFTDFQKLVHIVYSLKSTLKFSGNFQKG